MKLGKQTPTVSVTLPYTQTYGGDAVYEYELTGRTAQDWQKLLLDRILAVNDDGLWAHQEYGYAVPRRNGKNEVVSIVELYGMIKGERILHTAHRTTTSHAAALRLVTLLNDQGYEEVIRVDKKKAYSKHFVFSKQFGLERIRLLDTGGTIDFRTRSGKGGLGEGFDTLIIDEAQEYTTDQDSALKYVVSDSKNGHIIYLGTPPTMVSSGTVFVDFRKDVTEGRKSDAGWAEWSVDEEHDPNDTEAWYTANPSLGTILTERTIRREIGKDTLDFNIQRLGYWVSYNQKSVITETDWDAIEVTEKPKITGDIFIGVKFASDGGNVSVSVATRTTDGRIYAEGIDCRPVRDGISWITTFARGIGRLGGIAIDGVSGQDILITELREAGVKKKPVMPSTREAIIAYSMFEGAVFGRTLAHGAQPSLKNIVTNCDHRPIGSNGGFGYKSLVDEYDVSIMESVAMAHWLCATAKETKKQTISY